MESEDSYDTDMILVNFFVSLPYHKITVSPVGKPSTEFRDPEGALEFITELFSRGESDHQGVYGEICISFVGDMDIQFDIRNRKLGQLSHTALIHSSYLERESFVQLSIQVARNHKFNRDILPESFLIAFADSFVRHHPDHIGGGLKNLPPDLQEEMIEFIREMFIDLATAIIPLSFDNFPSV